MFLNGAAYSNLYTHETKKSLGLGILHLQMLTGFLGGIVKDRVVFF